MSTYDPKSVQGTIGGVPFDGFTAVKNEDESPTVAVDLLGRVRGTDVTGWRRGAIVGTSPRVPALATRADLGAAGLGLIGEQAARLMDGMATTKYRDDAAPPMRAGADGTALARMTARVPRANPFSRVAVEDTAVTIGETMGLRVTATAEPPDPPDGRVLVTVRCESRPLRNREMREIRETLQQRAPMGASVVVRCAASLDAKRDRALAPLLDPPPRPTREALRARFDRLFAAPKLPLP